MSYNYRKNKNFGYLGKLVSSCTKYERRVKCLKTRELTSFPMVQGRLKVRALQLPNHCTNQSFQQNFAGYHIQLHDVKAGEVKLR